MKNKVELLGPVNFKLPAQFGRADNPDFEIMAYTGTMLQRIAGNLVIDVSGIQAKDAMPIFREHDQGQVVGHSLAHRKENGAFLVSGRFSTATQAAKDVAALAKEGFPWQASMGIAPLPGAVSAIPAGKEATINMHKITGPAQLWSRSNVFEISVVALAADADTSVATFDGLNEDPFFDRAGEAARFHRSPELQAEFQDVEVYLAYLKAEQNGLCRIYGR